MPRLQPVYPFGSFTTYYKAEDVEAHLRAVEAAHQQERDAAGDILQAVLDAIKGTIDTSTNIADHPNVLFAQMQRLHLVTRAEAAEAARQQERDAALAECEQGLDWIARESFVVDYAVLKRGAGGLAGVVAYTTARHALLFVRHALTRSAAEARRPALDAAPPRETALRRGTRERPCYNCGPQVIETKLLCDFCLTRWTFDARGNMVWIGSVAPAPAPTDDRTA